MAISIGTDFGKLSSNNIALTQADDVNTEIRDRISGIFNATQNISQERKTCEDLTRVNEIFDAANIESLKQYSIDIFDRFTNVWKFDDFWKRGNTCDSCLCFSAVLIERWPNDLKMQELQEIVHKMLSENLDYFNNSNLSNKWADDFGWWGLMGINAYEHLKKMGNIQLAEKYLQLSTSSCWEYMINIAYDSKPDSKPVPNGCRNSSFEQFGVKNTVANALLFLLSTRLYRLYCQEGLPDRDRFLDIAYKQWVWFFSWFQLKEYAYLKPINGIDAALVQERPAAFFSDSDYQDMTHPSWSEDWVWSGDQGLLVGALMDLLDLKDDLTTYLKRVHPDLPFDAKVFAENVLDNIGKIGRGVQSALVGKTDGVIREAPCFSSLSLYGDDYFAGRGVLVRYLDARKLKALVGVDLKPNINSTMNALWSSRITDLNQFKTEFTAEEDDMAYIKQFRSQWGTADVQTQWVILSKDPNLAHGICQSIGMDFLRAVISK